MSKKQGLNVFQAPLLLIKSVEPTLEKDETIYAYLVKSETESGKIFEFRERRGIPMKQYVGKTVYCILEILDADFIYPETKEEIQKLSKEVIKGEYLWENTGYKFIPELVKMIEGEEDDEDYDYDEDEYDRIAEQHFNNWGNHGIGLNVYQHKPMAKTEDGIFLFNEFRNEETIDEWELGDTIYFQPKQILLRGLKLTNKPDWRKNVKEEAPLKHYEMQIKGKPRIIDPW